MKTKLKRFTLIILFVIYYCLTTIFFAWLAGYMNIAGKWFPLYLLIAELIIIIPTILGFIFTIMGKLDNILVKK